jgi:hypothetical protein
MRETKKRRKQGTKEDKRRKQWERGQQRKRETENETKKKDKRRRYPAFLTFSPYLKLSSRNFRHGFNVMQKFPNLN